MTEGYRHSDTNYQILDEVEQNIVICHWQADQLFAEAEGRETLTNHNILQELSSIIVLSFTYTASFYVCCVFFFSSNKVRTFYSIS